MTKKEQIFIDTKTIELKQDENGYLTKLSLGNDNFMHYTYLNNSQLRSLQYAIENFLEDNEE